MYTMEWSEVLTLLGIPIMLDKISFEKLKDLEKRLFMRRSTILRLALSLALFMKCPKYNVNVSGRFRRINVRIPEGLADKLRGMQGNRELSSFARSSIEFLRKFLDLDPFLHIGLLAKKSSIEIPPLQVTLILNSPLRHEKLEKFLKSVRAREIGIRIYQTDFGTITAGKLNEISFQPSRENPWRLVDSFLEFLCKEKMENRISRIDFNLSFRGEDIGCRGS